MSTDLPSTDAPDPLADERREDAASRVTAYVYGNVLVVGALVALDPAHIATTHAIAVVLGTGVATYIAHVFSDLVGERIRHGARVGMTKVFHELRLGRPILVSAILPALALAPAALGLIDPLHAYGLAVLLLAGRLAAVGWVLARAVRGLRWLPAVASGLGFALVALLVAALKVVLTH